MSGASRVDDLKCVTCGADLLDPNKSPLSMCTECFKNAQEATKKQIGNQKNRKGTVKTYTIRVDPRVLAPRFQK